MTLSRQIERAFERFSDSVLGYYHLANYFNVNMKRVLSRGSTHEITCCLQFYRYLREGRLKHKDRVRFKNFFVTEWIPRSAGGISRLVNTGALEASTYEAFPGTYSADSLLLRSGDRIPPFGSVRFPLQPGKRCLLGAVTEREYHADLGVVLSVTPSVYQEFLAAVVRHNAVEATIEGHVELFEPAQALPQPPRPRTLGVGKEPVLDAHLLSTPNCVVRIESPFEVRFKSHTTHPPFNAWLIRRRVFEEPGRFVGLRMRGIGKEPEWMYTDPIEYEYFYLPVRNNETEEIEAVRSVFNRQFLGLRIEPTKMENSEILKSVLLLERMKPEKYRVVEVRNLTEFDGRGDSDPPLVPLLGPHSPVYLDEVRAIEAKFDCSR